MRGRLKLSFVFVFFLFLSFSSFSYASETTLYFGSLEKNLNTGEKKIYIPVGNSMVVKTLNSNGSTKNTSYLHSDHLGSTVLITKQDGSIDSSMVYYPFGNGVGGKTPALQTDKLYTSQRLDNSTSLYFYNARYYNPKTGRFISADSAQGSNRYAYVGNNPVMRSDPSGKEPIIGASGVLGGTMGFGAGSQKPLYLPDDYISREEQIASAAMFGAVFGSAVILTAGVVAGPEIAAAALPSYVAFQQLLNSPKGQLANGATQIVNTGSQAACSGGVQAGCAVAEMTAPFVVAGSLTDSGYAPPPRNKDWLLRWAYDNDIQVKYEGPRKSSLAPDKYVAGAAPIGGKKITLYANSNSANPYEESNNTLFIRHEIGHAIGEGGQTYAKTGSAQWYKNECINCEKTVDWLRLSGYPQDHPYVKHQMDYWQENYDMYFKAKQAGR